MNRIIVVGASLAGLHAAAVIRRRGHDGSVVLVGDEPHYPYDRPPLSKDYLAGSTTAEALRLRPAANPDELGVEWRLGHRATGLSWGDAGGTVLLDDGTEVEGDGLVVATGATPRHLPGTEGLAGLHVLRTVDDADALRADLDAGPDRVLVIGCGFIGAEVAATARERGLQVTIVEAAPAPLMRVLDADAGMAVAELHRGHGVDVRLGVGVASVDAVDGAVAGVTLDDGSEIPAAVVVVGIGVVPNTGWLEGSSLTVDDGVVTDHTCLAAPGVVAAGDVARWPHARYGDRLIRVEQWDNAVEMGRYVGDRLLAFAADGSAPEPFAPIPWFWSDQYDRKIQLAGLSGERHEVVQGSVAEQRFVQLYLDDEDQVVGALCWNRPRQAIMARQLLAAGAPVDEFREKLG